jgi:hypothetical protein
LLPWFNLLYNQQSEIVMNRKEMLRPLLNQAQFNGFEFRRWFQRHVHPVWPGAEQAMVLLGSEGRYYTLVFSHDFARSFWRSGAQMSFIVPSVSYPRVTASGDVVQVTRKPYTRRLIKRDAWKYHLRQMALAEDPILYLYRYLPESLQPAKTAPARVRIAAGA